MVIGFIGDSITFGVGASQPEYTYVNRVKKTLGCDVVNYGISGTRIARQIEITENHQCDMDFNLRLEFIDPSLDRLFVFGGTNDFGHGRTPFGEKDDTDVYTFHGAVNTLCRTLIDKLGKEKIVFLIPLKRADTDCATNAYTGKCWKDYVEVINYYVDKYGLKKIDLFSALPTPPFTESEFFIDGLHPNDKGYSVIAEKICEFIKNDK